MAKTNEKTDKKSKPKSEKKLRAPKKAAAEKPEARDPDLIGTESEALFVKFNEAELRQAGSDLAQTHQQIEEQDRLIKVVSGQQKADLKRMQTRAQDLASKIRNGGELRDVKVNTFADWKAGTAKVVRMDTNETIRDRLLHMNERQLGLPLEDGAVSGPRVSQETKTAAAKLVSMGVKVTGAGPLAEATAQAMQQAMAEEGPAAEQRKEQLRDDLERQADGLLGSDVDGNPAALPGKKRRASKEGAGEKVSHAR